MNVQALSDEAQAAAAKRGRGLEYRVSFGIAFAVIGIITAALFLSILKINHGTFTYTLDDPYIHLALSDQIIHGNYGIHAGQHAAPSSSILFPFLLVIAAGTSFHPYLPLLLNVAALFLTIEIVRRFFAHLDLAQHRRGNTVLAGAAVVLAVCLNIIGIVFTGLEHSLHIATVAAIVYGLVLFLDNRKMPAWLPFVIVLCPLFRYEGLPLSIAAVLVLAVRGRWRTAAIILATVVILIVGFSVFLVKLGLQPLPDSVLVKSAVAADGISGKRDLLVSLADNVIRMFGSAAGLFLALSGIAAGSRCLPEIRARLRDWSSDALMALVLVCMVLGHALAGQFGWFCRYEIYALAGVALIGIYLARGSLRNVLACGINGRVVLYSLCFLSLGLLYLRATTLVPFAANNVYEQQYQMHRFVNDFYRAPVAVNDLGLVSYRNPEFVLDLGGLASEKARILDGNRPDPGAYDALLRRNNVHLAMIYDELFVGRIPGSWTKVGTMELSRAPVSVTEKDVQFYAIDPATAVQVRRQLVSFRRGLPSGVKLTLY